MLDRSQAGLIALDELVAVALRQVVVGVDVEPPEQLLLPRRQRLGAHGLDVDERHQAEHLQPLLGADDRGELLDDLRDPRCRGGTPRATSQVVADQEEHRVARLGVQVQAVERLARHPHALDA
jgi:hypothetical protein